MYVGGYGGLSESGLCVFSELCPGGFLVVGMPLVVLCGQQCSSDREWSVRSHIR